MPNTESSGEPNTESSGEKSTRSSGEPGSGPDSAPKTEQSGSGSHDSGPGVRIDKWLWAARFFKTRSQAGTAVTGGLAHLNGDRVKRAKAVKVGDTVRITKGPYEFVVMVRALGQRRGPASEAAKLYEETEESRVERERIAEERRLEREAAPPPSAMKYLGKGRPTKKDRRAMARLKRSDE